MRAIIQRVSEAKVSVDNEVVGAIGKGLLVLIGIENNDSKVDIEWLCKKIINQRLFSDQEGKMNKSLIDIDGKVLLISQFTLFAQTKKGNRPSFIRAAKPEIAIPLYNQVLTCLKEQMGTDRVAAGEFGADMQVSLLNDGPVTIYMDTKNKE